VAHAYGDKQNTGLEAAAVDGQTPCVFRSETHRASPGLQMTDINILFI